MKVENQIDEARKVTGKRIKDMAAELRVSPDTIYGWRAMTTQCPAILRQSVDRAIGSNVDWFNYDKEFFAEVAERRAALLHSSIEDVSERHTEDATGYNGNSAILDRDAAEGLSTELIEGEFVKKPWWSGIIHDDTADAP